MVRKVNKNRLLNTSILEGAKYFSLETSKYFVFEHVHFFQNIHICTGNVCSYETSFRGKILDIYIYISVKKMDILHWF